MAGLDLLPGAVCYPGLTLATLHALIAGQKLPIPDKCTKFGFHLQGGEFKVEEVPLQNELVLLMTNTLRKTYPLIKQVRWSSLRTTHDTNHQLPLTSSFKAGSMWLKPAQFSEDGSLNQSGRELLSRRISKLLMLNCREVRAKVAVSAMPLMEVSQVRSKSPDVAARPPQQHAFGEGTGGRKDVFIFRTLLPTQ